MDRKLVHESQSVDKALQKNIKREEVSEISRGDFDKGTVSTGSTLLDLSISGNRVRGGGVPAGVIVEVFGPSGCGKTAVLAETSACILYYGGDVQFLDPEARLDTGYARLCGLNLEGRQYERPDTVENLFKLLETWVPKPTKENAICATIADSLAAFTTEKEMTEGDKMAAARRAAGYHAGLRKFGRMVANNGWIIMCSNQEQDTMSGMGGKTTPGGNAWKYWSSVRMRVTKSYPDGNIEKQWKRGSATIKKVIGIKSIASIVKNSVDDPFREAPLFIMFGRGIDDVRGNLMWLKDKEGTKGFNCVDKEYTNIYQAVQYIEDNNLEAPLRDMVIDLWEEIEDHFRAQRKPKARF